MKIRTIHEEPFAAIVVHVRIAGKSERAMCLEKLPDMYHINWRGDPDPVKYLGAIQRVLDRSTIPDLQVEIPYALHTVFDPNEDTPIKSYKVIPPLTWEEIQTEGDPLWFQYETPLAVFAYFPKDAEQYGIASSSKNTEVWVGLIKELASDDIPERRLSQLLAKLADTIQNEHNLGHYLAHQNSGVVIQ